jgi:hypothetical protein
MPKHTVTKRWNETSLPFLKSDQAVYSTQSTREKHIKTVQNLNKTGNESVLKKKVSEPKVGKPNTPFLGSRGTVVPRNVSDLLWELEGIKSVRTLPSGVQRLVYRLWFSQEIIVQRNYFKKVKRTEEEKVRLLRDIDGVSKTMKMASGLSYNNFPSVVTAEKLALLFTSLELPSGVDLTQAKNILLQKKQDEAFVTMLYSNGVGRPHYTPKKQHNKLKKELQPPTKVSTSSTSSSFQTRLMKRLTSRAAQLNGSHGEATNTDDVNGSLVEVTIEDMTVSGVVTHGWYDGPMFELTSGELYLQVYPVCEACESLGSAIGFATLMREDEAGGCHFCENTPKTVIQVKRLPVEDGFIRFLASYRLMDDIQDDVFDPCTLYAIREDGTWVVVNDLISVSQINGLNGEWTGSDDVDAVGGKPQRRNKPLAGAVKPVVECKFFTAGTCTKGDKCKFIHVQKPAIATEPPKKESRKTRFAVMQNEFDFGFDGDEVCRKTMVMGTPVMVSGSGKVIPHVIEGEIVTSAVGNGHGWVDVEEGKGGTVIASGAMAIQECFSETVRADRRREIFLPLQSYLKKHLCGASKDLGHVRTAALSIVNRSFSCLDAEVANNTIAAFLLNQAVYVEKLSHSLDQLNASETNLYVSLGECIQNTGFWREYAVDANIKMDWPVREDVYVLPVSRGLIHTRSPTPGRAYVEFTTRGDDVQKTYITCMVRFRGNTTVRFVEYRLNGFNCKSALKRLMGCNDNNDMYMAFQYRIAKLTAVPVEDMQKFWKLVRVSTNIDVDDQIIVTVGNKIHKHTCNIGDANMMKHYTTLVDLCVSRQYQGDVLFQLPELHTKVQCTLANIQDQLIHRVKPSILQFCVDEFVTTTNWAYHKIVEQYYLHLDPLWSRQYAAKEIVHIKRKLRMKMYDGIALHANSDCLVKELNGCLKREFAKPGKAARFFVSYGEGSIYAPELPEILKLCIHGTYYLEGSNVSMSLVLCSKLKKDELHDTFEHIIDNINTRNHLYFVVFSDDSCLLGNYKNHRVMANIDISSCDSSNRFPIFAAVYSLLYQIEPERALGLVEQCTKPIKIVNPSNEAEVLRLVMDSCFEGSGTCLTTVLNHIASLYIGSALFTVLDEMNLPMAEAVPVAAALVGHKVTYEEVSTLEKVQFLKRSPMLCVHRETGERRYRMCLNMGTIFRGFGTVEGDMSALQLGISNRDFAQLTLQEKMDDFLSVVVEGLKTEPSNVLLDALRQRFCMYNRVEERLQTDPLKNLLNKHYMNVDKGSIDTSPWQVEASGLPSRYDLSDDQIELLISQISNCRIGAVYTSPAVAAIFAADYGLMD